MTFQFIDKFDKQKFTNKFNQPAVWSLIMIQAYKCEHGQNILILSYSYDDGRKTDKKRGNDNPSIEQSVFYSTCIVESIVYYFQNSFNFHVKLFNFLELLAVCKRRNWTKMVYPNENESFGIWAPLGIISTNFEKIMDSTLEELTHTDLQIIQMFTFINVQFWELIFLSLSIRVKFNVETLHLDLVKLLNQNFTKSKIIKRDGVSM